MGAKIYKILVAAGARPNFMKVAPLLRALKARPGLAPMLVHTGQHYDAAMSGCFLEEFGISEPEFRLGAGSGTHGAQTARILAEFEELCMVERPDLVVVAGDVNSTIACALAAKKLGIDVAHVEAGLRSFDRSMPEEINRVATDSISDLFLVSEDSGVRNLLREGQDPVRVHLVGNLMIDTLLRQVALLPPVTAGKEDHVVMTLHRPSNVDDRGTLAGLLRAAVRVAERMPVYFPVHPRTAARIQDFGLSGLFRGGLHRLPPLGYHDFLALWREARLVLTDSGGLQEETTALGVPCFTLRKNTERPATVEQGTNILIGNDPENLVAAFERFCAGKTKAGRVPPLWDGRAAERATEIIVDSLDRRDNG